MNDDIVKRLRHYPMSRTGRLEDEAADEIERLREEVGYAKLMYDKHMAERLSRAEAEIERLREQADRADKVIEISRYMAIYGATPELWKQLDNTLLDYDKER